MTTTDSIGTALANREFSDAQLQTRIELNKRAGYGLEKANAAQLNIVFLMAQRYQLDPVSDITLYEGRPWITIDGRVRLMRRHPEYRGFSCRPLSKDEKEAWGYEPDDIVVECIVRTSTWGELSARGKVSAAEVRAARERAEANNRKSAPVGMHPVEIAEKRAIARAERAAFGQDAFPDEEEAELQVIEVRDQERVRAGARDYDRVFGTDEDRDQEGVPPEQPSAGSPSRLDLFEDNHRLVVECRRRGLDVRAAAGNADEDAIATSNARLRQRLEEYARTHGDGPPPAEAEEAF